MLEFAELLGTVVFAISGVIAVAGHRLDWFGAVVVGVVTAIGGGTIRGMLLGELPVFWIENLEYLVVATAAAVLAIPIVKSLRRGPDQRFDRWLQLADAAGLALFAVAGASVTLDLGFSGPVAVVCGIVTGVGGGVIRDLLAGRQPLIMRGEIYATAALAGTTLYVLLEVGLGLPGGVAGLIGVALVLLLRVAGMRRGWQLPAL